MRYLSVLIITVLILYCQNATDSIHQDINELQANEVDVVLPDIILPTDYSKVDYVADSILLAYYIDSMDYYYSDMGPYDESLILGKKAYLLSGRMLKFDYRDEVYETHLITIAFIGWRLINLGYVLEGERLTNSVIDLFLKCFGTNHFKLSEWMVALAECYEIKGDMQSAEHYNLRALDIIRNTLPLHHRYYINVYWNLACIKVDLGDYDEAIYYMNKSLEWAEEFGPLEVEELKKHRLLSNTYTFLAKTYLLKSENEFGASFLQLIKQCDSANNIWNFTDNYFFIKGFLAFKRKDYRQAQNALIKSVFNDINLDYKAFKSRIYDKNSIVQKSRSQNAYINDAIHLLADISFNQEDYRTAMEWYDYSIIHFMKEKEADFRRSILPKIGIINCFLAEENLDSALLLCERYLEEYKFYHDIELFKKQVRNETYSIEKNALRLLQLKGEILVRLYNHTPNTNSESEIIETFRFTDYLITELIKRYDFKQSKKLILQKSMEFTNLSLSFLYDRYLQTHKFECLEMIFSIIEKSKSIILNSELDYQQAKYLTGISRELLDADKKYQNQIRDLQTLLINTSQNLGSTNARIELGAKLVSLSENYRLFQESLEKEYPHYRKYKNLNSYSRLTEVQAELPVNTSIVEYHLTDSFVYIMMVNSQKVFVDRILIDSGFLDSLSFFTQQLAPYEACNNQEYHQYALHLYRKLLGSAEYYFVRTPNLVIIPHKFLSCLSFEALCQKKVEDEVLSFRNLAYLLNDYNIRYEYSISTMNIPHKLKDSIKLTYCGFAPSFSQMDRDEFVVLNEANRAYFPMLRNEKILPLIFNRDEVILANQIAGGQSFLSQDATEENFKKFASRANILHLATHAFVSETNPSKSHLVFFQNDSCEREDGNLYRDEIEKQNFSNELTILSACNSGSGNWSVGEGALSLANAFKYAGSKNLLISLKSINDESTKLIINYFFTELSLGKGKSTALSRAKKKYISNVSDDKYAHPQYWANLVMIGDDTPLISEVNK